MKYLTLLAAICLTLAACNSTSESESSNTGPEVEPETEVQLSATEAKVVGTWNSQQLSIEIHGLTGGKRDTSFTVDKDSFMVHLGIAENIGHYHADRTYQEYYYDASGKELFAPTGTWSMEGDSFIVNQKLPYPTVNKYYIEWADGGAIFSGMVDWDSDGQKDDFFQGYSTYEPFPEN